MNSHNTLVLIQSSRNFVPCILWVANFSSNQAARKKEKKIFLSSSMWVFEEDRSTSRDQYCFPPSQCRKPCPHLYWPKYSEFLFLTLEAKRGRKKLRETKQKPLYSVLQCYSEVHNLLPAVFLSMVLADVCIDCNAFAACFEHLQQNQSSLPN